MNTRMRLESHLLRGTQQLSVLLMLSGVILACAGLAFPKPFITGMGIATIVTTVVFWWHTNAIINRFAKP